jgi:hypothetical protein
MLDESDVHQRSFLAHPANQYTPSSGENLLQKRVCKRRKNSRPTQIGCRASSVDAANRAGRRGAEQSSDERAPREKSMIRDAPQAVWCSTREYTRACGKKGGPNVKVSFGTANVRRRATVGVRKNEKNPKILLTQNDDSKDTPRAPATAFPANVPAFLPLSARRKTVSKEYRCLSN